MDEERYGLSNTPPLTPGPSLEAEERAMRTGRGSFFLWGGVAVLVLIGALIAVLLPGDDTEIYELFGRNVTSAKGALFDGYWACVLGNAESMSNNEELERAVHTRAQVGGRRFITLMNEQCAPKLTELEQRLESLIPPDDMHTDVEQLTLAVRALRGASSDYVAYVEDLEEVYDVDDATDNVHAMARAWYEFRAAYSALQDKLREKL